MQHALSLKCHLRRRLPVRAAKSEPRLEPAAAPKSTAAEPLCTGSTAQGESATMRSEELRYDSVVAARRPSDSGGEGARRLRTPGEALV